MEQSDSDNLQPPSLDGVFARKRREKGVREDPPMRVVPQPTPVSIPEPAVAAEPAIEPVVEQTAVLAPITVKPASVLSAKKMVKQKTPKTPKAPKTPRAPRAPKTPKAPSAPREKKARGVRRIPALIPTVIAGASSGGVLVGLVAAFNRWGGQTDSVNAVELLGSFLAAIVVGYILLAIGRIAHRAAIAFLGIGLVAVVLMFFPSDLWQTLGGGICVVLATALGYAAAQRISREATDAR